MGAARRAGRGKGKNGIRPRPARVGRFRAAIVAVAAIAAVVACAALLLFRHAGRPEPELAPYEEKYIDKRPELIVELLDPNEYSRPMTPLDEVRGVVVHYTANPGTSAEQNRSYFENLKDTGETYASSHFVIGIGGEIVQCIPCSEIAYASNERNGDTIAIECCIPDESGKFTDETYQSLVRLVAWLMGRYGLSPDDVIRHYDVTGKNCPKYFVEHEDAWEDFKGDLVEYIDANGVAKEGEIK